MNEDKQKLRTLIICGLALGISIMCFIAHPVALFLYFISVIERTSSYILHSTIMIVVCALGALGSLAASIVAKVLDKTNRWPIINIVFISIVTVIRILLSWGFIALVNQMGT